jgi:hypothetical protein
MSDEAELDELLAELRRVGVDPNALSAGLAIRPEAALRILRVLPDGAGPAAFLTRVRVELDSSRASPQS